MGRLGIKYFLSLGVDNINGCTGVEDGYLYYIENLGGQIAQVATGTTLAYLLETYVSEINLVLLQDRYDILQLTENDLVLVRNADEEKWMIAFYGQVDGIEANDSLFISIGNFEQIIPYNDDNRALLGTTDIPDIIYRWWEPLGGGYFS